MKRVLIITYHWPPRGGAGVQRWLKMSKYLPEFGFEPVICTVEEGEVSMRDEQLTPFVKDCIQAPIWEPFNAYRKLLGKKQSVQPGLLNESGKSNWKQALALWIRANCFIPDAKMFWIRPAKKAIRTYLKSNQVDCIVSTGPPHTTHIIAKSIAREFNLPWIADFRDPWTNIDYADKLPTLKLVKSRQSKLERQVLQQATAVVTVSWQWAEDLQKLGSRPVEVITNGFDPADFTENAILDSAFTILHTGSMNGDRNPLALWKALHTLKLEKHPIFEHLKIHLIGPVDFSIQKSITEFELDSYLVYEPNQPHALVIKRQQNARILLLPINDAPNISGIIPGKLYEYLGANRPILAIGDRNGDALRILDKMPGHILADFQEVEVIQTALKTAYSAYLSNTDILNPQDIQRFSRRELASKYVELMTSILK